MDSQANRLLWFLNAYGSITRLDAASELGIFELSARVIDLEDTCEKCGKRRKKCKCIKFSGYNIPRKSITVSTRFSGKCRVTQYGRPERQLSLAV